MTIQWTDRSRGATLGRQPVAEDGTSQGSSARSLTGVTVEVVDLHGPADYLEDLRSDQPRLTAILEEVGGHAEIRLAPDSPVRSGSDIGYGAANRLTFVPAGTRVWHFAKRFRYIRRIVIDFDLPVLAACFAGALEFNPRFAPRLMFRDSRVQALAELLADACAGTQPDNRPYGDSLALAISYNLFRPSQAEQKRSGLAPARLRRVKALMEQSLPNAVALKDLAEMTGLSESYFSRAFKISTGMAPHRWHLAARIRRAQKTLLETDDTLADVALACGFADQSHFSRVFRTIAGKSPGAWRKSRGL